MGGCTLNLGGGIASARVARYELAGRQAQDLPLPTHKSHARKRDTRQACYSMVKRPVHGPTQVLHSDHA